MKTLLAIAILLAACEGKPVGVGVKLQPCVETVTLTPDELRWHNEEAAYNEAFEKWKAKAPKPKGGEAGTERELLNDFSVWWKEYQDWVDAAPPIPKIDP